LKPVACGGSGPDSDRAAQVAASYEQTCWMLREAQRGNMARLAYKNSMEQGGTITAYVAANCGPEDLWATLVRNERGDSWCVVAIPQQDGTVVVEEIGADPQSPLRTEIVGPF
ncbi:MAG TPA: hypothetical protein PKM88_12205, partial [bacterium]|nr:hypothetical protein [bacterium]